MVQYIVEGAEVKDKRVDCTYCDKMYEWVEKWDFYVQTFKDNNRFEGFGAYTSFS